MSAYKNKENQFGDIRKYQRILGYAVFIGEQLLLPMKLIMG